MMDDCTCSNIVVGLKIIESKNWNPHCIEHGYTSHWYNSEEEVQKRKERIQRTRQLFAQASLLRLEKAARLRINSYER